MKQRIMAICDKDERYLEMLQSYLLKKKPAGYEILVFSTVLQAVEASKNESFEIFLIGENTYSAKVKEVSAQKIFILQEDGLSGVTEYSFIAKYQSIEKLINQALDEFATDECCTSLAGCGKNKTKLISFYSPDRHSGQATAALCASELLSDMGNKVLYISMSSFSGFEELLGKKYDSDITDFMYFVLKHSDKLLYKLESIKQVIHNVDYLPPALDYSDLMHISEADWQRVMDLLLYSSDYTHIIIDLSEVCQGFYHILDNSDKVYILTQKGVPRAKAALNQYEKLMKAKEHDRALNKSKIFSLKRDWENYSFDLERLSVSELGIYMKGIILEDEG